jgi:hypothetical protein
MKKAFIITLITALVILLISSCNDPVFFHVSQDHPALEPMIPGSPTKFIEFNNAVYVASGNHLWNYTGTWSEKIEVKNPNSGEELFWIVDIAATASHLYIVVINHESKGELWRAPLGLVSWERVEGTTNLNVQSIFTANNVLFIGARVEENSITTNNVYYFKDEPISSAIITNAPQILNGVAIAGSNYFLSAGNVYSIPDTLTSASLISGLPNNFLGIINTASDRIVGITYNGGLFYVNPAITSPIATSGNDATRIATGALAVWANDGNRLLLIGRYSGGYMEMVINTDGSIDVGTTTRNNFRGPGLNDPSSVGNANNARSLYINSINRRPVNFIFQTPSGIDEHRMLLASTQLNGVWSFRRHRNDNYESWNAEER